MDAEVSKNGHGESCVNELTNRTGVKREGSVTGWYSLKGE